MSPIVTMHKDSLSYKTYTHHSLAICIDFIRSFGERSSQFAFDASVEDDGEFDDSHDGHSAPKAQLATDVPEDVLRLFCWFLDGFYQLHI